MKQGLILTLLHIFWRAVTCHVFGKGEPMRCYSSLRMLSRSGSTLALLCTISAMLLTSLNANAQFGIRGWPGYGGDAQHTGISSVASQPMERIIWHTSVDPTFPNDGREILIHYGSPLITKRDTVVVTVRTDQTNDFRVEGHCGYDGSLRWTQTTDYKLPYYGWIPPCGPTLAPDDSLYVPAAGGTVLHITGIDTAAPVVTRMAFYGVSSYNANPSGYDGVRINTPLTSDAKGNIYFGFLIMANTINPSGLTSGVARLSPNGTGTWVAAPTAAGDNNMQKVLHNCAPALSNDGSTLYVGINRYWSGGYLVALDSTTLATKKSVLCQFPGHSAYLADDGTASPTVGPDGDVYFGVWDSNHARGWMLHYDSFLTVQKNTGSFGWDDTSSIVPATAVPSYTGTSSYLILTKYNNYADGGIGGDGMNKVAILDPNDQEIDPITGATVMKEVFTLLGPTKNPNLPGVREWCINMAAIDPQTKSAIINCEDGNCYRWDFTTNKPTEKNNLSIGVGEAYTSTLIGPTGNSFAINNANLFCMGPNVLDVSYMTRLQVGCQHPYILPGTLAQEVRVSNIGNCTLTGPISMVLDNLSPYAKLMSATGTTSVKQPAGSPYITVTTGPLPPGQARILQLIFTDSTYKPVNYKVRFLAGTGPR